MNSIRPLAFGPVVPTCSTLPYLSLTFSQSNLTVLKRKSFWKSLISTTHTQHTITHAHTHTHAQSHTHTNRKKCCKWKRFHLQQLSGGICRSPFYRFATPSFLHCLTFDYHFNQHQQYIFGESSGLCKNKGVHSSGKSNDKGLKCGSQRIGLVPKRTIPLGGMVALGRFPQEEWFPPPLIWHKKGRQRGEHRRRKTKNRTSFEFENMKSMSLETRFQLQACLLVYKDLPQGCFPVWCHMASRLWSFWKLPQWKSWLLGQIWCSQ